MMLRSWQRCHRFGILILANIIKFNYLKGKEKWIFVDKDGIDIYLYNVYHIIVHFTLHI